MSETLSQQDIDSLLRGAAPAAPAASGPEVMSYDFLRPPRISRERRITLEVIFGRYALAVQGLFTSRLRTGCDVTVVSVEQATFGEFIMALSPPAACFVFALGDEAGHEAVIDLGADLSIFLVDRLFGGPGEVIDLKRSLTTLERTVVQGMVDRMLALLKETWADHLVLDPSVLGFEASPEALQVAPREANVLVVSLDVKAGSLNGIVTLCLPLLALESFLQEKAPTGALAPRKGHSAPHRAMLEPAVRQFNLDLRVCFPAFKLSARQVAALKPGQVLLTRRPVDAPVELHINGRRRFLGTLGQYRGRLGLRLTQSTPAAGLPPIARAPGGKIL